MEVLFPAVIEGDNDSGYSVHFPDLPGCVSAGDTVAEVFSMAREALELHLEGMIEDGETIPDPMPLDRAQALPTEAAATVLLVPAMLPGRTQRINVTLDEGLIGAIDRVAANRSAFLADAARDALRRRREAS